MADVAFVSTYPPQVCGIAAYTRDLIAAISAHDPSFRPVVLAEHGAARTGDVEVWPCFDGETDYVEAILDRLDLLNVDVVHLQHEYGIFGIDDRFPRLLAGLRQRNLAVVVTLHTVHTALSFDLGCSWRQGRPRLGTFDVERYQRRLGRGSDAIVVHQEAPIRQVLLRQGLDEARVRSIPHGTAVAPLSASSARGAVQADGVGRTLVAFGYFEPAKNYPVLLEAFAQVLAAVSNVRLVLGAHIRHQAPDTLACRARCTELVGELGLDEHVTFLDDPVAEADVEALFAEADAACFVYDEDTRSSSGALHRAAGYGVPIVASRIPKFAEVSQISDELLVNPHSPEEIARVLIRILREPDFAGWARYRSRSFAELTSWDRVAAEHLSLYRSLSRAFNSCTVPDVARPARLLAL
jgi:glycosyltransferase involved in cell wall biosynthesis